MSTLEFEWGLSVQLNPTPILQGTNKFHLLQTEFCYSIKEMKENELKGPVY